MGVAKHTFTVESTKLAILEEEIRRCDGNGDRPISDAKDGVGTEAAIGGCAAHCEGSEGRGW